ncbi:MAG: hypothetical protein IAG13_02185 [Deltaproteobacteria bacterium]|nr:hypothetical protein [Nannocystaceae bacterium]
MPTVSILVTLALLASAPVTAGSAPKTSKKPVPTLKLKVQPTALPEAHVAHKFQFGKAKKLDLVASNVGKVSVSAQRLVDGAAFMLAYKAYVVPVEAEGFRDRGVHIDKSGHVAVVVPRTWVGTHDVEVDCTGDLPPSITAKAILISISGLTDYGEITLTPDQGRARFVLTTSELGDGNWVFIQVGDSDPNGQPWRADGCSVARV